MMKYDFLNDVQYSEKYEKQLIDKINALGLFAKKTERSQYPDVEVYDKKDGNILCFIEVKVQRRTFMTVEKYLPNGSLIPSETVALNQSDLEHYIEQSKVESAPIFIMWVLSNRPCITGNTTKFYYNHIGILKDIFEYYKDKRRFRRKSGVGDIVNGQHKGVVVNYHFSLNELLPFSINDFLRAIKK
ncbi:hypothetical protein [Mannheimia bovis]|uniref:hypothetical protein n=1 Tax=Mannheimia bovis TaxID=2770636 RepID=UPI001ABBB8E3|nr:hypothetical protein [Mannheimia bovis]